MDKKNGEFLKRLLSTFRIEAEEHLKAITSGLIEIENGDPLQQARIVEAIFRESHNLKGAARSVNLTEIVAVCQTMENHFSALKRKQLSPSQQALDLIHRAVTVIGRLVAGEELSSSERAGVKDLTRRLDEETEKPAVVERDRQECVEPSVEPEGDLKKRLVDSFQAPLHTGTVRISASKLDALLLQAEEMLSVKLAAAQNAADLRELKRTFDLRKKEMAQGLHGRADSFAAAFERALTRLVKNAELDRRSIGVMVDTLLADMKKTLMLPFSSLLEVFPGMVRNLSRNAKKEAELTTHGGEIEIDRRVLEEIKDPLVHLVRNCIDHAIELPEERKLNNKRPQGRIGIVASSRDNKIEIVVSDDGAGIDAARVKAAAEKMGLISHDVAERLSERSALQLVFRSGLSTSPIITDISGRGLGLAIVKERVEKLGGTVEIESQPSVGATIRMIVPLTLATFQGILVAVNGQPFVLPSANVLRAARVNKEEIRLVENRESLSLDGQALSLVRLADALGLAATSPRSQAGDPLLQVVVLGSAEMRMAFVVDEILHEQEVLVKPLGRQLQRLRNFLGATILGNGVVVPILNVSDLMISALNISPTFAVEAVEGPEKRVSVLVAEDSITARTLLRTILESAGYNVKTAVDGMDAFNLLKTEEFDLLVSDVDMPRMNGFDLTSKIRADKELSELPVVLVTALESLEDKARGIDAGANAYIVKSSFDQSNLLEVVKRLI